jgi:AcrR family transcriptional regulator
MGGSSVILPVASCRWQVGNVQIDLYIVKMFAMIGGVTSGTDRYHHGDLPNALRSAAVEVIDERGLGAFSLREVARRAGVSHTAPAHHFGDVRGLLTSVAVEGFDSLHAATAAAAADLDDPVERLTAIGEAYVELARSHHAHLEVMFRTDVVDPADPELQRAGLQAYGVLEATVRTLIESDHLDVELDHAVWLCWSAMQGLVVLGPKLAMLNEIQGGADENTRDLVRRFTQIIVNGLRSTTAASTSADGAD